MKLTKLDMARVVVQALYNMPTLPAVDNHRVLRIVRRNTVASLANSHRHAVKVLQQQIAAT